MTHVPLLALLLAIPLGQGILTGQQAQDPSRNAPLAPAAVNQVFGQFAALQHTDVQLVGAGIDYRARFATNGAEFAPALGEAAPVEFPVTLRGVAFGRGGAEQALPVAEPTWRERTVSFRRGTVEETYEVRPQGLKQSFVFHERPAGRGDLTVAVQVATQLALQTQNGDAVTFGNEFGGVRIDAVLGIDARGRTCKGSLSFAGDRLQLRLPAAFVDEAALPLVLDPMLGAVIPTNATGQNLDPQVAYDADLGKYLVVWWRRLSASTGDIYGQFVNRETTGGADLSGGSVVIRSGSNSQRARVADCSVRNAFVVAWQDVLTVAPLPTHRDLYVRAVTPTTLGTTFPLAISFGDEQGLEMASNATESSSDLLTLWIDAGYVYQTTITVSASFACGRTTVYSSTSIGGITAVRVSRSGGVANRNLVAYLTSTGEIMTRLLEGVIQSNSTQTWYGARSYTSLALDGDGDNWFLAATMLEVGSTTLNDIVGMTFGRQPAGNLHVRLNATTLVANPGVQDYRPTVAMSGRNAVLAWTQGSTTQALGLRTFGQSLCAPCEDPIAVFTGASGQQVVACLAAQASGRESGATRDDALLVWQGDNGTASALQAQRWTPADGIALQVAPGCGGLAATAVDECANHRGSSHLALLQNAPAGATSWLLIGFERRDATGCGPCVLVPELSTSFVFGPTATDAYRNASWSIPIAGGSQVVGLSYYQQWLVQDAATPGCPAFQFDLSNALQVTIQ